MREPKRVLGLLVGNLVAVPLLASPSFVFLSFIELHGVALFLTVAWTLVVALALALWRMVAGRPLLAGYSMTLVAAALPVILAWAFAARPLYWPDFAEAPHLRMWTIDAVSIGGFFTAGYWLPASIINCWLLRRAAGPHPPDAALRRRSPADR